MSNILKAITLSNFKGIRNSMRIELKPITLLFGPNSAGKSTLLQALIYTREVLERRNLDPDRTLLGGEWMDLGGFDSLIHGHDRRNTMTLGFELDLTKTDLPDYVGGDDGDGWLLEVAEANQATPEYWLFGVKQADIQITIRWSELLDRPLVERLLIDVDGERIAEVWSSSDGRDTAIEKLLLRHPLFVDEGGVGDPEFDSFEAILGEVLDSRCFGGEAVTDLSLGGQSDALPAAGRGVQLAPAVWREDYAFDGQKSAVRRQITALLSSLIAGPIDLLRGELERLVYIGPLREVPSRQVGHRRSPDISRWARGAAAWDHLHEAGDGFIDQVNDWLAGEDRLDSGYALVRHRYRELTDDHPITLAIDSGSMLDQEGLAELLHALPLHTRIALRDIRTDLELCPQDIGVGISQVLPIVVAALEQRAGILAVEQPELHIHPALQVALGDLFASRLGDSDALYLLETHSEHLMLRLLRRIRETTDGELPPKVPELHPDQIAVYFVENADSGVRMTRIGINEDGEFTDRWPRGFFPERREELF